MRDSYRSYTTLLTDVAPKTSAGYAFAFTFIIRMLALPLSVYGINPYSEHDAIRFDMYAEIIANGNLQNWDPLFVYHVWSGILSPFYLLPGPGPVYARIFIAALGAASVYFVFRIAETLTNRHAALFASLPLMIFPSFVMIQVSLIRETGMLFLHSFIAYLFLVPNSRVTTERRWLLTAIALVPATLLRKEHLPVYLLILSLGVILREIVQRNIVIRDAIRREIDRRDISTRALAISSSIAGLVSLTFFAFLADKALTVIAGNRSRRARGNSVYLQNIIPDDILTAIWFAPIGVAYFYFAPFPWMIEGLVYLPALAEGMLNIGLAIAAVYGAKRLLRTYPIKTVPLLTGFILFSIFYGLVEANVGAAIRHRQQLVWVLYLFAGVGIVDQASVFRT